MSKLSSKSVSDKVNAIVKGKMPGFAMRYFKAQEGIMAMSSLYVYASDMATFFKFLSDSYSIDISTMSIKDLENITPSVIEDYLECCQTFYKSGKERRSSSASVKRRYSVVSSFFMYYFKESFISSNPALRVNCPRVLVRQPPVPSKESNSKLLEFVSTGNLQDGRLPVFQEHSRKRDSAIMMLMICAGIKASECSALNIQDLNLEKPSLIIRSRKRNPECLLSSAIAKCLSEYLTERIGIITEYGHDDALFLSCQRKRLGIRSIEILTKKYTKALFGEDAEITPNDLRKSFRYNLFKETKNIPLVADLTDSHPYTIYDLYKAELLSYESQKSRDF